MTGAELKTFFLGLIDEEDVDDTLFYQLLNAAKNEFEEERDWEHLKAKDETQTSSSGETYTTSKDLPTDFRKMISLFVGTDTQHDQIPYEDQIRYKDGNQKYYLDIANSKLYIIGTPASTQTIYQFYIKYAEDVTATTAPTFPSRFHAILGYMVAGYWTAGVDADDIYARMSNEHKIAALVAKKAMYRWDDDLKLGSIDRAATPFLTGDSNRGDRIDKYR